MVIIKIKNLNNITNFTGVVCCCNYSNIPVKFFIKNGYLNRYYGPANIHQNNYKEWHFNNKCYGKNNSLYNKYSQSQFFKDLNKQWLL